MLNILPFLLDNYTKIGRIYSVNRERQKMKNKKVIKKVSRGALEQQEVKKLKQQISYALDEKLHGEERITRTELCERLETSLPQLHRLLDPNNYSITLMTLIRVAQVVGKKIEFNLVELE